MPGRTEKHLARLIINAIYRDTQFGEGLIAAKHLRDNPAYLDTQINGQAPLAALLKRKKLEAVRTLLLMGARTRGLTAAGQAVEHLLRDYSGEELDTVVQSLVEAGHPPDWNVKTHSGFTPLDMACQEYSSASAREYIMAQGGRVGNSVMALGGAIRADEPHLWDRLLDLGANPAAVDPQDGSLWHVLARRPDRVGAWLPRLLAASVPQTDVPGLTSPLGLFLEHLCRLADPLDDHTLDLAFSTLAGQPKWVHYTMLLLTDKLDVLFRILPKDITAEFSQRLWCELDTGLREKSLAAAGAHLLAAGHVPPAAQWARLFSHLRSEAHLCDFYAAASKGAVRIPWRLSTIVKRESSALVQAWLRHQGHPALAQMLCASRLLEGVPPTEWVGIVQELQRKDRKIQKAPALTSPS